MYRFNDDKEKYQEEEHPWDGLSIWDIFFGFFIIGVILGLAHLLFI
jgi:hypothetical protein